MNLHLRTQNSPHSISLSIIRPLKYITSHWELILFMVDVESDPKTERGLELLFCYLALVKWLQIKFKKFQDMRIRISL